MLERGAYYAEGVGELEPRVASTLGSNKFERFNAEGVGHGGLTSPESFQSLTVYRDLIPGLKQPWATISERLRRKNANRAVSTQPG
jgi:hypothetical protein